MATTLVGRRALGAAAVASLPLLAAAPARAQGNWPSRPVTLVVPYAAGAEAAALRGA